MWEELQGEHITFKKPKEIWEIEHHWREDCAQILGTGVEGENERILLLLWGKSLMSKCLVSWKETRFQLSHPIAWKDDETNSLKKNRIQVGK